MLPLTSGAAVLKHQYIGFEKLSQEFSKKAGPVFINFFNDNIL